MTLTAYDRAGNPRWVLGTNVAPDTNTSIPLSYYLSPFQGGVPTSPCSGNGCRFPSAAGTVTRTYAGDGYNGTAAVAVDNTATGGNMEWYRYGRTPTPVAIQKVARANEIVVNRQLCTVGTNACEILVSWTSDNAEARAWRVDLATNVWTELAPQAGVGTKVESFSSAGRYRYFLTVPGSPNLQTLASSAEVVISGQAPATSSVSVDRTTCVVAAPQTSCAVQVTWSTSLTEPVALFRLTVGSGAWALVSNVASGNQSNAVPVPATGQARYRFRLGRCPGGSCTAPADTLAESPEVIASQSGVTLSANPSTGLVAPATTQLTAVVSSATAAQSVEFRQQGNLLCTVTSEPYVCEWNQIAEGSYSVTAQANFASGPPLQSAALPLTVSAAVSAYSPPDPASMLASDAVGASNGSFRVSESGDATYSIPFYTAPSAGGMGPSMALAYSSSGAYGAAGVGWSIQGLSAISRCRRTLEHGDGADATPSVQLNANDAYCLDGQRLVRASATSPTVPGGVCAANNASVEYRTEIESFRAVCAWDSNSVGGGHAWFAVWGKDGSVSVYGRDAWSPIQGGDAATDQNSRLLANAGTPRAAIVWALARVEDSAGNYYDYSYGKDEPNGEQWLAEVNYDANRRANDGAGMAPDHRLRFNYQMLPTNEIESGRVHLASTRQARVLDTIDSLGAGDAWLRQYRLAYAATGLGERRKLVGFTECSSGVANATCYPPTTFEWSEHTPAFAAGTVGSGTENGFEGAAAEKFGDVNGDGLTDVVWLKRENSSNSQSNIQRFWVTLTTRENGAPVPGGGDAYRWDTLIPFSASQQNAQRSWHLLDYNGDGRDDLLRLAEIGSAYQWRIHLSVPDGSQHGYGFDPIGIVTPMQALGDRDGLVLADFTGDGLSDALVARDGGPELDLSLHALARSPGGAQPYAFSAAVPVLLDGTGVLLPGDLGDQRSDIWSFAQNLRALSKFQPVDVNADGRADLSVVRYTEYIDGVICTARAARGSRFLGDASVADMAGDPRGTEATSPSCLVPHPAILKAVGLNASGQFVFSAYGPRLGQTCYVKEVPQPAPLPPLRVVTGSLEMASVLYGDFSGDGYADALFREFDPSNRDTCSTDEQAEFAFRLNRGDGFGIDAGNPLPATRIGELDPQSNSDDQNAGLQFLDVDGDARADLVYPRYYGDDDPLNRYRVRYWNGSGFDAAQEFPNGMVARGNKNWKAWLIDLDNDGWVEGLRMKPHCSTGDDCHTQQVLPSLLTRRPPQRIERILTGLGAHTWIEYAPLSDDKVYARGSGTPGFAWGRGSPVFDLQGPLYVVKSASSGQAPGETAARATVRYFYSGGRVQGGGRGFLGFSELQTYADVLQGGAQANQRMRTTTRYRQEFPFTGAPEETRQELVQVGADGLATSVVRLLSMGQTSYQPRTIPATPQPLSVLRQLESAIAYDLANGAPLTASNTHYDQYDAYGNLLNMTVRDHHPILETVLRYTTTVHAYAADQPARWWLGRLTRTDVMHVTDGGAEARTSTFEYDPDTGLLWGEVVEPDGKVDESLRKTYELDVFGNRVRSATCSNHDFPSRASCLPAVMTTLTSHHASGQEDRIQRFARASYDSRGRYVREGFVWAEVAGTALASEVRNQWTEQFDRFGNPTDTRSANGGIARAQYGALGREHARWSNDGAAGETRYAWCTAVWQPGMSQPVTCPADMSYRVEVRTRAGTTSWSYHDVLGRVRYKLSEGYADSGDPEAAALGFSTNEYVAVQTEYDLLGRAFRSSEPYFAQEPTSSTPASAATGVTIFWTTTQYDALGRPRRVDLPEAGAYAETSYQGLLTVSSTIACAECPLQTRSETRNHLGQLVETLDAQGMRVWNSYDQQGRLQYVDRGRSAPVPTLRIQIGSNKVGHKVWMIDPDKGGAGDPWSGGRRPWYYTVNALGEVIAQTDAKGQRIESSYDANGRVWQRRDIRANGSTEAIASFEYDTAQNGLGALHQESSTLSGFRKTYAYDGLGRPREVITEIDGVSYTASTGYDAYGRVETSTDAAGDVIRSEFTRRGFVKRQREGAGSAAGSVLNEVRSINARGQVVEERRGGLAALATVRDYWPATGRLRSVLSGGGTIQNLYYEWDFLGNLRLRRDQSGGNNVLENFDYDTSNRLTTVTRSLNGGAPVQTLSMGYVDPVTGLDLGNIHSKSDVGSYSYAGTACGAPVGPHAVTSAAGASYCYDANGNQTEGGGRTLQYSVFDKPLTIDAQGVAGASGDAVQFVYGTGRELVRRADANGTQVTRFAGGIEVLVSENATRRQAAGTIVRRQGSTRTLHYVYTDHLGSVSAIVDASGTVTQRQSFDAFGARRAPADWQAWTLAQQFGFDTSLTRKGYTGHEGVERTGLIHFGGRLYDPRLGRFVQADPLVEDANLVQGLNRYSYVLNNPLSLTDPTGYLSWSEARPVVAIAVNIVLQNYVGAYGFIAQVAIGATTGAIAGGSRGAVQGAFSAGLFYGIGSAFGQAAMGNQLCTPGAFGTGLTGAQFAAKVALHGLAGGVMSSLGGGKFGHGFVSAAGTQLSSSAINQIGDGASSHMPHRVIAAAVVGGTIAELTGGKFANGAVTGAFSRAFNDELHLGRDFGGEAETCPMGGCPGAPGEQLLLGEIEIDQINFAGFEGTNIIFSAPSG